MNNLRLIAARVIGQVTNGRSLSDVLPPAIASLKDLRDMALVQAICYGVCRFYPRLDVILSHLLQKPMKEKDSDVHALLLVGLYQLVEMRIPEYAAVTETVNATQALKKPWARGLVNAILREYIRQRESLAEIINTDNEALYMHPAWWIKAIKTAWPNEWQTVLQANNEHPPFTVRVNAKHTSRDAYLETLAAHKYHAHVLPETKHGLFLESPIAAESLPGFAKGDVTIQDGAAQLAAELLQLAPGQQVLDACAAPGGKLTHLLECESALQITAVEKDIKRMASIKENLVRLHQLDQAKLVCDDAANVAAWWDNQPFDRILLDAPCSASGVIRRHPDIKLLREVNDIKQLAAEQLHLLTTLWPTLKSDGLLLYVTCSIFPQENTDVIRSFLASHPDAKEEKITVAWGLSCDYGRQILPGMHHMDGFYYALLKKARL